MTKTMQEIKKMTGKELADYMTSGQYEGVTEGLFFQVEIEGYTVPLELEINSQGYVQTMANMGIITQEQAEDEEADYNELIEDYYFGNEEEVDKYLVETNRDEIIEELEENLQEIKDEE